ncbi:MAG: glucosaminidase domain-containing protein [Phormidesmis sp. CAN_BIN44]|nr:glucosaminidase domain-containing protein [Phormidesmis sp. CAN_BIN44]
MALLNDMVKRHVESDLEDIFSHVGIQSDKIPFIQHQSLQEVTLAQWLLESARATSELAISANNFAGLKWRDQMAPSFATKRLIKVPSESVPVEFCQFNDIDAFLIGYWNFLTRSPYKGLEDHTNTPENFIGFLQRKGYAADRDYVTKVLKLLPEAQQLLTQAQGVLLFSPVAKLQITRAPKEVGVGQSFRVEGTASANDAGKILLVKIDDRFDVDGTLVNQNGQWLLDFVFKQSGNRKFSVSNGTETVSININSVTGLNSDDDEDTSTPSASRGVAPISLQGSVGKGGVNHAQDVEAIKQRLHTLGYNWVDPNKSAVDTGTGTAIRLFQSIISGRSTVAGDGRIDIGAFTHQWLQASNAPRWQIMPKSDSAIGFVNYERNQTNDEHDFGTSWLAETILDIAKTYQTNYRKANPSAAPFAINDVSQPHGGDTPDHSGHETGLMCDVLLPKRGGDFGGIYWWSPEYDREAMRALLKAMHSQKLVRAIFFNDSKLIAEGLCTFSTGHDHHVHFEIDPPVKV